jgi:hypothetical protein
MSGTVEIPIPGIYADRIRSPGIYAWELFFNIKNKTWNFS